MLISVQVCSVKKEIGIFGTIHKDYERKGQDAINFLLQVKEGEVPNAIFHHQIGWIDIVWGFKGNKKSDGYGLSKIQAYHPSVLKNLAETINKLEVVSRSGNRFKLKGDKYEAAVSRVWFETKKTWLLTLFEKK